MGAGEWGAGEGTQEGPAALPTGPRSTPPAKGLLLALGPRAGFSEGAPSSGQVSRDSLGFPLVFCAVLLDPDPGAGGPGPQGRCGERRGGAEEERVPGGAGKAAGAARPDPVQPRLAAGERQQDLPGRKGKTPLRSPLVLFQMPVGTPLSSSAGRGSGGDGVHVMRGSGSRVSGSLRCSVHPCLPVFRPARWALFIPFPCVT